MLQGDRVRIARQQKSYTQEHLARLLNIGLRQIARYEAGQSDITGDALLRMADILEVSADYLLGRMDDPTLPTQSTDLMPQEREIIGALRRGEPLEAIKIIVNNL
jgi:transcriptional regulator with XRE-family HTH domain